MPQNTPFVFVILDGWGIAPPSRGNALSVARLPVWSDLIRKFPVYAVAAGGEAVGLPWAEAGNSEVGHLNLGAGRIVYQEVLRINKSIEEGAFFENEALIGAISHCKQHNSSLHIVGLLSDGGVHSHQDHIYAAIELAAKNRLAHVYVHAFLDGRDVPFDSGRQYVSQLEQIMERVGVGKIATMSGRFYAMDRDNHWERTEAAYKAMAKREAKSSYKTAAEAIDASYAAGVYDEEFVPAIIELPSEDGGGRIQSGDAVIICNYRPDRARQITKAFALPTLTKFERPVMSNLYVATLTQYEPDLPVYVAFKKELVDFPIARVWSEAGLKQLHIAETEKYAHVTYFFNGGKDVVFPGQENVIIPSAGVASYSEKPEMSTPEITRKVLEALDKGSYDCIVANLANADMVGHTGNLRAAVAAAETVDAAFAAIVAKTLKLDGTVLITADHGNAEEMVNWENGHIVKEHTASPVPCVIAGNQFAASAPRPDSFLLNELPVSGVLSDVTLTALEVLGLEAPADMTSRSLLS